ncbi:MAG: hypothetical protein HWE26_10425 [Alteromonadaceae bacterium]|nr:hypothetical protein [Alteromonadaceae bacterium]
MNTLIIGSSHVNSLQASRNDADKEKFGSIRFLTTSQWSLLSCGTAVKENQLTLARDPIALLSNLNEDFPVKLNEEQRRYFEHQDGEIRAIAGNIRELYQPSNPDVYPFAGEKVDKVIIIFYTAFTTHYERMIEFAKYHEGYALSSAVCSEIPNLGGNNNQELHWGPHIFRNGSRVGDIRVRFSELETCKQIASLYPDAEKVVCIPPPKYCTDNANYDAEKYHAGLNIFKGVLDNLLSKLSYSICFFPEEVLDSTGVHCDLSYSVNPDTRDPHKNGRYGKLLWKKLEALF